MPNISILLLGFLLGHKALAGSYSVKLREFGFNRANCNNDIAAVAQSFATEANVVILSSGCLPLEMGESAASGEFTYAASHWVETTTSDVREALRTNGYYRSMAECQLALQNEHNLFVQLTGLKPFVGYCYKSNPLGSPRFRARLDAIGVSTIKKHSISTLWMHKPVNEYGLVADVTSLVTAVGGEVVAAMVDRRGAGYQVATDYYHQTEFRLHAQELLYWRSTELCQASASSMKNQWVHDAAQSTFHCTVTPEGISRLLQVYLSPHILSGSDFKTEILSTAYPTQAACLTDMPRIRAALEQSGTVVLGTTCGQDKTLQRWQLALFSKTPASR